MGRYTEPRLKKMRALDVELPGLSRKSIAKRPYRPGEHGQKSPRVKDYSLRLAEKQKLRFNYGVNERQLRRIVREAMRSKTLTDDKIIELLERRIDNVVFRGGLAPTIPAARQLVNHNHIMVNDKRVDIASYRVKVGDVVRPREKSLRLTLFRSPWQRDLYWTIPRGLSSMNQQFRYGLYRFQMLSLSLFQSNSHS